jgi:uncharacterized protein (TIGR02246 family)
VGILSAEDRSAIEDLLSQYVLSLDVDDVETMVGLFTEDGEFRTHGRVFAGREQIQRMVAGAPKGLHLGGRSLITPSADGARVRQQLVFFPADRSAHRLAIYDDVVVQVDGCWRFRIRQCRFLNERGELDDRP